MDKNVVQYRTHQRGYRQRVSSTPDRRKNNLAGDTCSKVQKIKKEIGSSVELRASC